MNGFGLYKVDLNSLKQGVYNKEYQLSDGFFSVLDQQEIHGGDVKANIKLQPIGTNFMLYMHVEGEVRITCDRCLDEMTQKVSGDEELLVKMTTISDDDIVAVDPETGVLDLSWLLYELIEINLPIVHSHQLGECNPQMEELLQSHLCVQKEEPEE